MRKGRVIQIDSMPHPLRITCHSGTVWVSQTGAPKIFVLGAGDSFKPRPDGRLIIHALESACVAQTPEADDSGAFGDV